MSDEQLSTFTADTEPFVRASEAAALAQRVDALLPEVTPSDDPAEKQEQIRALCLDLAPKVSMAVLLESHNPGGLSHIMQSIDRVEEHFGASLFARLVAGSMTREDTRQPFRELYQQNDPALERVLGRLPNQASQSAMYDAAAVMEKIVEKKYGSMVHWKHGGLTIDCPEYMRAILDRPDMLDICLEVQVRRLESSEYSQNIAEQLGATFRIQKAFLENIVGISRGFQSSYGDVLLPRVLKKDSHDMPLPLNAGGGINYGYWKNALLKFGTNVEAIGVRDAEFLRRTKPFRLINLDRYSPAKLERTARVARHDAATIAELQGKNVILSISGSDGDFNNGNDTEPMGEDDATIYCEIPGEDPSEISDVSTLLGSEYGVQATTVFINLHGAPGVVAGGKRDGYALQGAQEDGVNTSIVGREHRVPVSDIPWRTMVLGLKPHSETGRRYLVLGICDAATAAESGQSVAERILRQTLYEDGLVISAPGAMAGVRRAATKARFESKYRDVPAQVFVLDQHDQVVQTQQNHIEGLDRPPSVN